MSRRTLGDAYAGMEVETKSCIYVDGGVAGTGATLLPPAVFGLRTSRQ